MRHLRAPLHRNLCFTLVEVLAALALAAIILPVAMRGISLAASAAGSAKRQIEAASLAEAKLAELIATGQWQGPELSGGFGADWPDYRWTAEVTNWQGVSLKQVMVTVEWSSRTAARSVRLATLVYAGSS
jgi:type II secretory pathway pseudopilin PulG